MNDHDSGYLLHVCCAPCASASAERLISRGEKLYLFYSNSNIYPFEEYLKRKEEVYRLGEYLQLPVYEDEYDHESWLAWVRGLEQEPERGRRCERCFRYSLLRTARKAEELGIQRFSTTLSISPHKRSGSIFAAADDLEGFICDDFKKRGGFARSLELSRELGFYRQCYCGCEFSIRTVDDDTQGEAHA